MASRRNPIPPHAKKMFSGVIFEVWQWEQKMFDGSTETFERLKRPNTAQVIATVGEKILTQTEEQPDAKQPFVSLPGGRCNEGEDALSAAKRELLEETGYESSDWSLWREVDPVGKIEWTVSTFIARNCAVKTAQNIDAGEKIETRLIGFDEFLLLADEPSFYSPEIVADLLRMRLDGSKRAEVQKTLFFT